MSSSSNLHSTSGYRTFTRGALVSLVGVLAAGIISYLIRRVLVFNLSPVEYGFFYSAFSFVSLGLAVVDLGLGKSGTVLMAKYTAQKKKARVNLFFSIIFLFKLLTGLLLGLLIWFWAPYLLKDYFSFPAGLTVLLCLAFFVPLQALSGFVLSSLEAMQDFVARTMMQVIYYSIVLGLILLLTGYIKILAPVLAYCGAAILVSIAGFFYLKNQHGLCFNWDCRSWFNAWPETWHYARWLTLSVIALATMNYIDTLMLTWLRDLNCVAGYQVALPIAQIARSLVFLPIIFMPIAADLWQRNQLVQIKNICNFVTLLMVFCAGVGFLLLLPFAEELISVLFDSRYRWAYSTLIVLGSGMPILVVAQFYLNTLSGMDSPRIAAFASLSGLVSNIIVNFFLIPVYGALGAAVATIFSFFVIMLVAYFYLHRKLNLFLSWGSLFLLLVIILGAGLCFRFCGSIWIWFSVAGSIYCGTGFLILRSHFILLKHG